MKRQKAKNLGILTFLAVVLMFSILMAGNIDVSKCERTMSDDYIRPTIVNSSKSSTVYDGYFRIFVVEPLNDRGWEYDDGYQTHYSFLDFALDTTISFDYLDTIIDTVVWSNIDYPDITEDNIMVIAGIYNDTGYSQNWGSGDYPFTAYDAEAAAGADAYNSWPNQREGEYTHSVILEEMMTTW
jgi:hypothetical protein